MSPIPNQDNDVEYINTYTPSPFMLMRHNALFHTVNLQLYMPLELQYEDFAYKQFTYNHEKICQFFNYNEILTQLINSLSFKYVKHLNADYSQYNYHASIFTNMANEYLNKYSLNHRGEMILYNETNNISCCWNFYNQENNMTDHLYLSNGLASNYWVTTESNLYPNI